MSEWYADEKPSGKPFEPPAQEEEVDVTYDEAGKFPLRCGPAAFGAARAACRRARHTPSAASPRTLHCFGRPTSLPAGAAVVSPRRFPRILPRLQLRSAVQLLTRGVVCS